MSPDQNVPWHCHSNIQDTFYVLAGRLRLFLREPREEVRLGPGDTYSVRPGTRIWSPMEATAPRRSSSSRASASTFTFRSPP